MGLEQWSRREGGGNSGGGEGVVYSSGQLESDGNEKRKSGRERGGDDEGIVL